MDIDSILAVVMVAVPTISSVVTAIATLVKVFKNFDALKKEVRDRTDLTEFREQMLRILEENYMLKEQISKLVEYSKEHPLIKAKEE